MAVVTNNDGARRLARTLVSDIALYNVKKVEEGIRNDSLFDILKSEIEEGRSYYISKVEQKIVEGTNLFNQALIDVLVKPTGRFASKVW